MDMVDQTGNVLNIYVHVLSNGVWHSLFVLSNYINERTDAEINKYNDHNE